MIEMLRYISRRGVYLYNYWYSSKFFSNFFSKCSRLKQIYLNNTGINTAIKYIIDNIIPILLGSLAIMDCLLE